MHTSCMRSMRQTKTVKYAIIVAIHMDIQNCSYTHTIAAYLMNFLLPHDKIQVHYTRKPKKYNSNFSPNYPRNTRKASYRNRCASAFVNNTISAP